MAKLKIFETKKKYKDGGTSTAIHIMGSVLPESKMKAVGEDAKVVGIGGVGNPTVWICLNCQDDDLLDEDQNLYYYKSDKYCCLHCKKIYAMVGDDGIGPEFEEVIGEIIQ